MIRTIQVATIVAVSLLDSGSAHAQAAVGTDYAAGVVLDQIVDTFSTQTARWEGILQRLALNLFGILAIIDIAFTATRLAFQRADLSEWLAAIVNQILFIGFFLWLLMNSSAFAHTIVDSFRMAAGQAGGSSGIAPSSTLADGILIAQKIMGQMSIVKPVASAGFMIAGIVIMICFGLMAAFMIEALVQSYILTSAGVLFMGFGGSRWTKDVAITIVRYTLSVGAKLFILQLIVGLGKGMITTWAKDFDAANLTSLCVILGSSIVMLTLTQRIPDMVQSLMNGSVSHQGSALTGAAMAVGGATAAVAAGIVGGGAALASAGRLASTQLQASKAAGSAPASRAGRLAAMTGYATRNLGSAAASELGRRFRGDVNTQHGSSSWRLSGDLGQRRRMLNDDLSKPRPEPAPPSGNTIS